MNKPKNISEFICMYPKNVQTILNNIRLIIKEEAPESTESILYGIPTFKLYGKNLVHFSAYKHHIGFYPTSSGIEAFKKELSIYKTAKGSVQFPLGKPIPYELIRKIVAFRVTENRLNVNPK